MENQTKRALNPSVSLPSKLGFLNVASVKQEEGEFQVEKTPKHQPKLCPKCLSPVASVRKLSV